MKDWFANLPKASSVDYLIDTCFLYYILQKNPKEFVTFCKENNVGITSFNAEEFSFHFHDVDKGIQDHFKHLMKQGLPLSYVEVDVHPGHQEDEHKYVNAYDEHLLQLIHDPSDAVLIAAALKVGASVLTRDKHHLFTAVLENYMQEKGCGVYNTLHL